MVDRRREATDSISNFLRNVVLVVCLAKVLIAEQGSNANPSLSRVCELQEKKKILDKMLLASQKPTIGGR
jgi:hypothetical protein